jgi:hypothetical protein
MPTDTSGRSLSDVLRSIVDNVQDIVRSELRLAKTEIGVELAKAKQAGVLLGTGAACGFFAVLFALLAVVFGLGNVVPMWTAALIVAAALGIVGGCMYSAGRKRLRGVHALPERAVETARENIQWAKQQIK